MRTKDIEVRLTIPFYYDKPDGNGNVYSKDAIYNALLNLKVGLPIKFLDNSGDEPKLIGHTTGKSHIVTDDEQNGRYLLTVDGVVLFGGSCEDVLLNSDQEIIGFDITSIGLGV